jgi:hypothetical protein
MLQASRCKSLEALIIHKHMRKNIMLGRRSANLQVLMNRLEVCSLKLEALIRNRQIMDSSKTTLMI